MYDLNIEEEYDAKEELKLDSDYARSYETKKNIPQKVLDKMRTTKFKKHFGYVEFDELVDLEKVEIILNERHYGALSGRNKDEVKKEIGAEQLHKWRRGFKDLPPQLKERQHDRRYDRLGVKIPLSESLEMTLQRLLPYWQDHIAPRLIDGHNQLIVAHGSSLRALIKYLDGISDDDIDKVEVPNGKPILYRFDDHLNVIKKTFITMDGEIDDNTRISK